MAYGQFTGYEPLPDIPGAYNFQTAGGKALTFGGPEADQLKARIDAANATTLTAGHDAAGGYGDVSQLGNFAGQPVPETAFPPPGAPVSEAQAASVAGGPPLPAPGGQLGYGMRVSPQGTIQKFTPGSAGVTNEQLQKRDAGAVAQRTGQTEQVQQGPGENQEYVDTHQALTDVASGNAKKAQADEMAAADEQSAFAAQQYKQAMRLEAENASRQADLTRKLAGEEALHEKAVKEFAETKVDTRGPYSGIAGVLGALAAGAGAYAAAINKTPNFAQQAIDQVISRSIREQEAQRAMKGDAANNLLTKLTKTGMSLEQARATAGGLMARTAAAQLATLQAKAATPAIANHYNEVQLGITNAANEWREQYRVASADKVARSTSSAFAQPRAATAGGFVDVGDQLGTAAKIQGLQKGEADINKANRDATKGPPASPEKRQAMSALADAANLEQSLKNYADDYVAPTTEQRNILGQAAEGIVDKVAGKGSGARATLSAADRRGVQDYLTAQQTLSSLQSVLGGQGALSGAERDAALAGLSPGATMGEVKRAVAMLRSRAETKLQAADATGEAGGTVVTK